MSLAHSRGRSDNLSGLPLFDWEPASLRVRELRHQRPTVAGKRIMVRFGISPATAELLAELAGIGAERTA